MGRDARLHRVEELVRDLQAEITEGIRAGDLGDKIEFNFVIPISATFPRGAVVCNFRSMPVTEYRVGQDTVKPRVVAS